MVIKTLLAWAILIPLSGLASAEEALCRDGGFPTEKAFSAAIISAPGRTYFYEDVSDCPHQAETCRTSRYLVQGDHILIAQQDDRRVCAWFEGRKYGTAGWIFRDRIEMTPVLPVSERDFIGHWRAGDDSITIHQLADGRLGVTGDAYWPGKNVFPYHEGHISDLDDDEHPTIGTLQGNVLSWGNPQEEYECAGHMTLVNGSLIVDDNSGCGGANVSFTDVYHRVPRAHH